MPDEIEPLEFHLPPAYMRFAVGVSDFRALYGVEEPWRVYCAKCARRVVKVLSSPDLEAANYALRFFCHDEVETLRGVRLHGKNVREMVADMVVFTA